VLLNPIQGDLLPMKIHDFPRGMSNIKIQMSNEGCAARGH
jgi:hypothetical protein